MTHILSWLTCLVPSRVLMPYLHTFWFKCLYVRLPHQCLQKPFRVRFFIFPSAFFVLDCLFFSHYMSIWFCRRQYCFNFLWFNLSFPSAFIFRFSWQTMTTLHINTNIMSACFSQTTEMVFIAYLFLTSLILELSNASISCDTSKSIGIIF